MISVFLPYIIVEDTDGSEGGAAVLSLIYGDGFIFLGLAAVMLILILLYKIKAVFVFSLINFAVMVLHLVLSMQAMNDPLFELALSDQVHHGAGFVTMIVSGIIILFGGLLYLLEIISKGRDTSQAT